MKGRKLCLPQSCFDVCRYMSTGLNSALQTIAMLCLLGSFSMAFNGVIAEERSVSKEGWERMEGNGCVWVKQRTDQISA